MHASDIDLHAQGAAIFTDDMAEPAGLLHAYPVVSGIAHGLIERIDLQEALGCPGVVAILLARDIPGSNNIGNAAPDEVLLAEKEVVYQGQPIAVVVAESAAIARQAAGLVRVSYQELPAVFDARMAHAQGLHIAPPRIFSLGDVDQA
jgi:xanthine dehydrogenase large subunit